MKMLDKALGETDGKKYRRDPDGVFEDYFKPPKHDHLCSIMQAIGGVRLANCKHCNYIIGFAEGVVDD